MGFITGNFADLSKRRIGHFLVLQVAGRDEKRRPRWKVRCSGCGAIQVFGHLRLVAAIESGKPEEILFCAQPACTYSRVAAPVRESLRDIREQEREAERTKAQKAADAKARAEQIAVAEAATRAEKKRWIRFTNSQMRIGITPGQEQFISWERWVRTSPEWRDMVLKRINGGA